VKFLFAVLIANMEEFAQLLKPALAKELDGMELLANIPFATTHALMDIARDPMLAIAKELDMLVPIVKFPNATQDAPILELVFFLILATVQQPMDGVDPLVPHLYAISLANMEETALVPMFATVKELDGMELNAQ
jgi:hypothetical protein